MSVVSAKAQNDVGTYHGSDIYTAGAGAEYRNKFNHLDVAITTGTTGIGAELAMPASDMVQIRAGFAVMPSFKKAMNFRVGLKNDPEKDKDGNKIVTKFDRMSEVFKQATGYQIDRNIKMYGRPTYYNAKVLVDVFPFPNKKWFVTAGFYYGNEQIAKAYNAYEGTFEKVGTTVNDTYLKTYSEPSGVQSYGEAADYLIAWYLREATNP